MWVTVDTAGLPANSAYRIRSTGTAQVPGLRRVSNQKMDNDLRNLSLRWERNANAAVLSPQVSRRIEVIGRKKPESANILRHVVCSQLDLKRV